MQSKLPNFQSSEVQKLLAWLLLASCLFVMCKKVDNPLEVDTDLPARFGSSNLFQVIATYPTNRALLVDEDNSLPGIQATVIITFSDYLDEKTIKDGFSIFNTTTSSPFFADTFYYSGLARKLYIKSSNWTPSSAFLLTLKSDKIKNRFGAALDGDGDGKEDGAPFDNKLLTFYTTGSSPDSCPDITAPRVVSISPDTQRIRSRMPNINITFNKRMDTLTFNDINVKLLDATGSSIPITIMRGLTSVSFQPHDSLLWDRVFTVKLISEGIKAESIKGTISYLRKLDGNFDGPSATEPDFSFYFLLDSIAPPTVANLTRGQNNFLIEFSTLMDERSLTDDNVKGFDDKGYNPGRIVLRTENNRTKLEYYFTRPVEGRIKVLVLRSVKSNKGRNLDVNGNGIGGEIFDDYWNR